MPSILPSQRIFLESGLQRGKRTGVKTRFLTSWYRSLPFCLLRHNEFPLTNRTDSPSGENASSLAPSSGRNGFARRDDLSTITELSAPVPPPAYRIRGSLDVVGSP